MTHRPLTELLGALTQTTTQARTASLRRWMLESAGSDTDDNRAAAARMNVVAHRGAFAPSVGKVHVADIVAAVEDDETMIELLSAKIGIEAPDLSASLRFMMLLLLLLRLKFCRDAYPKTINKIDPV